MPVAIGTALSLSLTGFIFGFNNNVFHLPIVGRLWDQPAFAQDAFVQSLRGFASGLWMLLEGSARWVDPQWLFASLFVGARALAFFAMVLLARSLGVRGRGPLVFYAVLLALSPSLRGEAFAGKGGLFLNYFSHSELATAITCLVFAACLRRRFGLALLLVGVVFFVNAFMAVWCIPPLLLMAGSYYASRPLRRRSDAKSLAAGAAGAMALAVPVVWRAWVSGVIDGPAERFDYRAFLADQYPYHFLSSATTAVQWAGLCTVVLTAWLASQALGARRGRPLRLAIAGTAVVYLLGVLLPFVTDARVVLNLHLLRSSVNFHFLAIAALSAVIVRAWSAPASPAERARAALLMAAELTSRATLVGAMLLLAWKRLDIHALAERSPHARRTVRAVAVACVVVVIVGQAVLTSQQWRTNQQLAESIDQWRLVAKALESIEPAGAPVMIPLELLPGEVGTVDAEVFESVAGRPVWVNGKRGSAVMWRPGYHALWSRRMKEQAALADGTQRLAYARRHGIAAVVERCMDLSASADEPPVVRAGPWCAVIAAEGAAR